MDKQLIRVFALYLTGHLEMSDILKDIIRMVINFESISTKTVDEQHIVGFVLEAVSGLRKNLIIMAQSSKCMSCFMAITTS